MAILRLNDVQQALSDVDNLAQNGGKMPAALRKNLKSTIARANDTIQRFRDWQP